MKIHRVIPFTLFVAASVSSLGQGTTVKRVQKLAEIPPIFVEKPFADPKAIDAFRRYVADMEKQTGKPINIPPDFYRAAPLITYWGYEFEANSLGTYDVIFTQKFDVSSVFRTLIDSVSKIREDNCSNWHVTGVGVTRMTPKEIDVSGGIQGTQMACTHIPFDGDLKTKVGDIGGSAAGALTFRVDTSGDSKGRYRGSFLANEPTASAQGEAESVFGFNTHSVVGQLITSMGHLTIAPVALLRNPSDSSMWESINIFNGGLWRAPSLAMNDVVFAVSDNGEINSRRYRTFLTDITRTTWSIQPQFVISDARSGLAGTPENPALIVSFVAVMKSYYPIETIEADISREIELLKSFSLERKPITVSPGQNFWRLSNQFYGTPYYYSMLAAANGMSRAQSYRVPAGKTIEVPPLYELPSPPQVHFMKPGETVSGLCLEKFNVPLGRCLSAIARANPRLSISHLYALEAIKLPPLPRH